MKKFVRSLLVASAFAAGAGALVITAPTAAVAQVTKDNPKGTPKVDPKDDPKSKTKGVDPKASVAVKGSVVIKPGKDGKFRFFVRDEDDKSLMQSSTGYATEDDAKKMLETVKAILAASKVTSEKADGK